MEYIIGILIGLFVGVPLGVLTMALCVVSQRADKKIDEMRREGEEWEKRERFRKMIEGYEYNTRK